MMEDKKILDTRTVYQIIGALIPILVTLVQIPGISGMTIAAVLPPLSNDLKSSSSYDSEEMSVPRRPVITGEKVETTTVGRSPGSTLLECNYEGNPTPQIIWLKNSKDIPELHEIKSDLDKGKSTLVIPENENETLIDGKQTNYTCVAANFLGRDVKSFLLKPAPTTTPNKTSTEATKRQRELYRWRLNLQPINPN